MKRIITTALAAVLLIGTPLAAMAQAEGAPAAEQTAKGKKKQHSKKKSKKTKEDKSAGEMK